jgi:uracil-DNA glycosylase family 4
MSWESIYECPACGVDDCVPPHNPTNSKILIVAEFPGKEEKIRGVPLVGRTGTILRNELVYMGWDLSQFGTCNLYQHVPDRIINGRAIYDNPECLQQGKKVVIQEAKKKRVVLLVGSDVAKTFLTKTVSEVNGLDVKEFLVFPFSAKVVMAMYNPAICFHSVAGEVRLALKKFVKQVKKYA